MPQTIPPSGTTGPSQTARDLRFDELELWDRVLKRYNEHVGRQSKIAAGVVSFVILILGFVGIPSLSNMIKDEVRADIEDDTQHLSDQLAERQADIAVSMKLLQQQTKQAEDLIAEIETARDRFTAIEVEFNVRIDKLEENLGRVDRIAVASLALTKAPSQPNVERTAVPPSDVQPDVFSALSIRQVPTPLDRVGAGSTRPTYLLTLSAAVDEAVPAAQTGALLNAVDRVTYTLSDKWFKPNVFVQTNRNDNFQFSVTVWGVTPIKAKAEFVGKAEPICWSGQMNLKQETKLSRTPCNG